MADLAIGSGGVLYGTARFGASGACLSGCGTVFALAPPKSAGGAWTETTIYSFTGVSDGNYPTPVVIGKGGVLYGATNAEPNSGTVFALKPPASPGGVWTLTTLYAFTGLDDGGFPNGVAIGKNGALYGTTSSGGTTGNGTVFTLKPPASAGGAWTETVLHSFNGSDGSVPQTGVVIGANGVLYGSTLAGGLTGPCTTTVCGTVFSLTPPGSPDGSWTHEMLYNFTGAGDGGSPNAVVVVGSGSPGELVLYGTTQNGGIDSCYFGCGTVFALRPPQSHVGSWTEAVLYNFAGPPGDSAFPYAGVAIGSGGVLYGTTEMGGSSGTTDGGLGTVFMLTPPASSGQAWTETLLHSFDGGNSDGSYSEAGVVIGPNGTLYGVTAGGGTANAGTVFALRP
ncbi:MAG: choice-of-anchor tandem repeat GloVer-containing protein [Bryobacteraceae bacterium]|jgi:uncharacterized repeat protein (TIGR03803 family)